MTGRAVVLSGGGTVGIAWETGVIAGLADAGVDLREADLIVGTSAGSVVGAQMALAFDAKELYQGQLARAKEVAASTAAGTPPPVRDLTGLMQVMMRAASEDRPLEERLAEVGRYALEAKPVVDEEQFVAGFAARLRGKGWPRRAFKCTAIEAETGSFVVWGAGSQVPLERAVASSCAIPGVFQPITIGGKHFYDGGIRSASNADLAAGSRRVVIISLGGGDTPSDDPRAELARRRLQGEITTLREAGAEQVELITSDAGARTSIGLNAMDPSRVGEALEAGLRQGRSEASRIAAAWS